MPKAGFSRTAGGGYQATSTYSEEWDRLQRMSEVAAMFAENRRQKREAKEQRVKYLVGVAVEAATKGLRPPEAVQIELDKLQQADPVLYSAYKLKLRAAQEGWSAGKEERELESLKNKQGITFYRSLSKYLADLEQQQGPMMSTPQGPAPGVTPQGLMPGPQGAPGAPNPFQQQPQDPMQAIQQSFSGLDPQTILSLMLGESGTGQQGIDPTMLGVPAPYGYDPGDISGPPGVLARFEAAPPEAITPEMMEAARYYAQLDRTPQQQAVEKVAQARTGLGERKVKLQETKEARLLAKQTRVEEGGGPGKGYNLYRSLPKRAKDAVTEALDAARDTNTPPDLREKYIKAADNALPIINHFVEQGFIKSEAVDKWMDILEALGLDLGE